MRDRIGDRARTSLSSITDTDDAREHELALAEHLRDYVREQHDVEWRSNTPKTTVRDPSCTSER
jgi:hypothetical protein